MEVLSLALLAAASGGLLLKARGKSKKEAFSGSGSTQDNSWINTPVNGYNPLFSPSVEAEGQVNSDVNKHLNYIEHTTARYNPFAGIFNPMNPSPQGAPDNSKIQNILRTYNTKPNSNTFYTYDSNTSDKRVAAYGVIPNLTASNINYCETKNIPTLSDGISKDCSVFTDSNFNEFCGVCHGSGTNSAKRKLIIDSNTLTKEELEEYNKTINKTGLYIVSGVSSRDEQQRKLDSNKTDSNKTDSNNTDYNKPPSFINWKPDVGTCDQHEGNVILNNFSVDSNTCLLTNNINLCSARKASALGSNGCYQCLADSNYYYVRPTISVQPTLINLKGSGTCSVKIDNTSYVPSGTDSSTTFTLRSEMQTITIPLDSNGNAADGKTLVITIVPLNRNTPAYIQGYFVGNKRTSKNANTSDNENRDIAITAYDITNGSDKPITPNYEDGSPVILKQNNKKNNLVLSVLIPYSYIDPTSVESMNCQGPYIRSPLVAEALGTDSCFINGYNTPGTYDKKCLEGIFTAAGCTSNGSGYPTDYTTIENLLKNNGSNRTLGEISQYVIKEHHQAIKGTTLGGSVIDLQTWTDSTHFCMDKNRNITDECGALTDEMRENGPVPLRCIQYLFNDGSNDNNPFGTYDRTLFSNAKSLWSGNLKDRFCTSNGSMAPSDANLELLQHINPDGSSNTSLVGVDSIKQFYRNIHSKANQKSLTNAQREVYVQQCYDSSYKLQSDGVLDPAINLGEEKANTTCGVKAKYIKITGADISDSNPNPYVKISQLIALDARGQNVALKKTASYSSLNSNASREAPMDGVYDNRNAPNIFVSAGTGPSEWYEINLGGTYDIMQVIYYNRYVRQLTTYTADGMKLELFDENRQVTGSSILTNALVQYINFTSTTAPSYCPKMYTGVRGNIIDPPTIIQENTASIMPTASNTLYTVYNSSPNPSSGAEWIWNDPYAAFSELNGRPVTFYTTVNNPTYQPIPYTMIYGTKSFGTMTNITVNDAVLTPIDGKVTFNINPGSNYIQATINSAINQSNGFQAVLSNSKTGQYEKPTNTSNWNTITTPSNSFSNTPSNITLYNIGGSNIWNQPNAGVDAGGEGMDFNLNLPVGGTSVLTYSLVYSVNSTAYKVTITVNKMVIVNNETSSKTWKEVSFQVVPGVNFIKVELSGGTGPSGFAAYIKDNTNASIKPTSVLTSGWYTTTATTYDCKNTCAYIPETNTNIPRDCLTNIWNSNACSGVLPLDDFSSYTMSGFSNMVYTDYAAPTATASNQTACYGAAVTTYTPVSLSSPGQSPVNGWAIFGAGSWIWNMTGNIPAGTTVTFYTSFGYNPSAGTYRLVYVNSGTAAIYLNGVALTGVTNNARAWTNTIVLSCKTGTNVVRVDITTGSTVGPAGFAAYLYTDNPNNFFNHTPTNWITITPGPCSAFSATDTNISGACLSNLWGAQCVQPLPTRDFSAYTMSGFSNSVKNNWASRTASNTNQIACKGTAVCDTGYTYNTASSKCEKTVAALGGSYWTECTHSGRPSGCSGTLSNSCIFRGTQYYCESPYTCSEGTLSGVNCLIQKDPNF